MPGPKEFPAETVRAAHKEIDTPIPATKTNPLISDFNIRLPRSRDYWQFGRCRKILSYQISLRLREEFLRADRSPGSHNLGPLAEPGAPAGELNAAVSRLMENWLAQFLKTKEVEDMMAVVVEYPQVILLVKVTG